MANVVDGLCSEVRDAVRYARLRPIWPTQAHDPDRRLGAEEPAAWRGRLESLARHVAPGARVLDLGCGDGALLDALRRERDARVTGFDLSPRAVELTRARGIDAFVHDARSGELPGGPYDHVIAADVLGQLSEPETLLLALRAQVRRSLLVTIPNSAHFRERLRVLLGRAPAQWLRHPAERLRFFSVTDFVDFARDLGWEVVEVEACTGAPRLRRLLPNLLAREVLYVLSPTRRVVTKASRATSRTESGRADPP